MTYLRVGQHTEQKATHTPFYGWDHRNDGLDDPVSLWEAMITRYVVPPDGRSPRVA